MSRSTGPKARTGRPPRTSRAEVMAAARELIDRDGWQRLTMRGLAAEIGVATTTVYYHVRDKEDLLVQLLSHYADQIPQPDLPADPRERLLTAARAIHDSIADWPWVAEVLVADDIVGESALWMVDAIVGSAIECGCTPEQAVAVYRSVWYYTVGEILVRASAADRHARADRPSHRDAVFQRLDPDRLPHLAALADRWPTLVARDTYAEGLQALVDGLLDRFASTNTKPH